MIVELISMRCSVHASTLNARSLEVHTTLPNDSGERPDHEDAFQFLSSAYVTTPLRLPSSSSSFFYRVYLEAGSSMPTKKENNTEAKTRFATIQMIGSRLFYYLFMFYFTISEHSRSDVFPLGITVGRVSFYESLGTPCFDYARDGMRGNIGDAI